MSSNWKNVLEEQQKDLDRLQALDAELTEQVDGLEGDITKVLKPRPDRTEQVKQMRVNVASRAAIEAEEENIKVEENMSEVTPGPLEAFTESTVAGLPEDGTPKAPIAEARYQKAKIRMLTQQVEESKAIRKKQMEQLTQVRAGGQ